MCGVLPDAPPPSVSCPLQWPSFSQPQRQSPGPGASRPEGGKRKSPNTPPPGHGPLCLSFSSGNPSPGSKTGASVRETGLCSRGHAYFFKTCSIFARPRSQRPRVHGWMDGRTDGQGVVRSQDKHRAAPPARGPESRQFHGDGDRMGRPGAEGPGARGPWHSNLMGTEFQSGTAKTSWGQTAVTVATVRMCPTPPRCALESGSDGEFRDVACVLRPLEDTSRSVCRQGFLKPEWSRKHPPRPRPGQARRSSLAPRFSFPLFSPILAPPPQGPVWEQSLAAWPDLARPLPAGRRARLRKRWRKRGVSVTPFQLENHGKRRRSPPRWAREEQASARRRQRQAPRPCDSRCCADPHCPPVWLTPARKKPADRGEN